MRRAAGPRLAGLVACAAGLALSACGTGADQSQARAAAEGFYAAVHSGDGAKACEQLSSDTRSQLVKDESEPDCSKAVLKLSLHGTAAKAVRVYATSAQVDLAGGDTVFLGETPRGLADRRRRLQAGRGAAVRMRGAGLMRSVRAMFIIYLVLIAAGLAYAIVLGILGH